MQFAARPVRSFVLLAILGALGACEPSTDPNRGAPPVMIRLSADSVALTVGGTHRLQAVVWDALGAVVPASQYTLSWASADTAVVGVAHGMLHAQRPGRAAVTASLAGAPTVSARTEVTVAPQGGMSQPVAQVDVTPSAGSLGIGDSLALAATLRDASGNVLTGRPVTWSSSSTAVATVTGAGVVTAVGAGSVTVTATSEGRSGTATVTVNAPAPPPPPPPPPPPSGTVLFWDDFSSGDRSKTMNGFRWTGNPSRVTITNEFKRSGSHSMRFHYVGKPDCEDATAEQRFHFGRQLREFWIEFYQYVPNGTEPNGGARYFHRQQTGLGCGDASDNNKWLTLWAEDYSTKSGDPTRTLLLLQTRARAATGDSRLTLAYTRTLGGFRDGQGVHALDPAITNNTSGTMHRGQWNQVRIHVTLADDGQENGRIRVWLNGALGMDNIGPFGAIDRNFIDQGYLMGWANSGFAEDTYFYIDDFRVYTGNPGW